MALAAWLTSYPRLMGSMNVLHQVTSVHASGHVIWSSYLDLAILCYHNTLPTYSSNTDAYWDFPLLLLPQRKNCSIKIIGVCGCGDVFCTSICVVANMLLTFNVLCSVALAD